MNRICSTCSYVSPYHESVGVPLAVEWSSNLATYQKLYNSQFVHTRRLCQSYYEFTLQPRVTSAIHSDSSGYIIIQATCAKLDSCNSQAVRAS
jgi:hypothetical protein